MEKYLIYALAVVAMVGVYFLIKKFLPTKKNSSWRGEVKEKKQNENGNPAYSVVVITEDDKSQEVAVSKILWNNLQRGDKIEKRTGDPYPRKV